MEPADGAHGFRCAVEAVLGLFYLDVPKDDEAGVEAYEKLACVERMVAEVDYLAGLGLLRKLDDIVPLDVVAGLGEVVVDVEDEGVAFFRSYEDPVALEGKMQR